MKGTWGYIHTLKASPFMQYIFSTVDHMQPACLLEQILADPALVTNSGHMIMW